MAGLKQHTNTDISTNYYDEPPVYNNKMLQTIHEDCPTKSVGVVKPKLVLHGMRTVKINGNIVDQCEYRRGKPVDITRHNNLVMTIHEQYKLYGPSYNPLALPAKYRYWNPSDKRIKI